MLDFKCWVKSQILSSSSSLKLSDLWPLFCDDNQQRRCSPSVSKFSTCITTGGAATLQKKIPLAELLTRSHVQALPFIHAASFPCQLGRGRSISSCSGALRCCCGPVVTCLSAGRASKQTAEGGRAEKDLLVRVSSNGRSVDIFTGSRPRKKSSRTRFRKGKTSS